MNLEQHEDNRYIKERDVVEKYLLRIIHRFFDIENIYNKESIEAIIVEAVSRYKQDTLRESHYLFSLNQRTGKLCLTIQDLKGELAFEKQSAFNKDFGQITDTICEGNDPRLSNERDPLPHIHTTKDISDLQKTLNDIIIPTAMHIHGNKSILDMLTYNGTNTEIDLIQYDYLLQNAGSYKTNLAYYKTQDKNNTNKAIEALDDAINPYQNYIDSIINTSPVWIDKAYQYTDDKIETFKKDMKKTFSDYITKQDIPDFVKYHMIYDNEIDINTSAFNTTSSPNVKEISVTITDTSIKNKYIKSYFRYDNNGQTNTIPFPFVYQDSNGITAAIQAKHNEDLYVAEFSMPDTILSSFTNPRIYYQMYGTKEEI